MFLLCFCSVYSINAKTLLINNVEIWNSLLKISVANKVSEDCESIDARKIKGLMALLEVKNVARNLGYTSDEIGEFVNSEENRERLSKHTDEFFKDNGVNMENSNAICEFGMNEINEKTPIGSLLRIKN
tara:strand:- start:559 stop:945 length:387 start_codon:yes stop_codon:yes gene_type:complete